MTDSEKESMKKQSGGGGKPGVRKGKKMQRHRKEDRKELLAQNWKKNKVKDGGGVAEVEKKVQERDRKVEERIRRQRGRRAGFMQGYKQTRSSDLTRSAY